MRIPPIRLASTLVPGTSYEVRTSEGAGYHSALPYTEALALAFRGQIEAIAAPSGRVKYLRMLADSEKPVEPVTVESTTHKSSSGVVAQTNLGAYRQAVESAVMDPWGTPTKIIVGHIWQLHMARI